MSLVFCRGADSARLWHPTGVSTTSVGLRSVDANLHLKICGHAVAA